MTGTVKWFDADKGYGFLTGADGQDAFAHHSHIAGTGFRTLKQADRVEYLVLQNPKGLRAENIRVLPPAT